MMMVMGVLRMLVFLRIVDGLPAPGVYASCAWFVFPVCNILQKCFFFLNRKGKKTVTIITIEEYFLPCCLVSLSLSLQFKILIWKNISWSLIASLAHSPSPPLSIASFFSLRIGVKLIV